MKKDLVGQRFGNLLVLEKTDQTENRYQVWKCQCDCGNTILVNTNRLNRRVITSCGCVSKPIRNGSQDLTGKRFGKLVVLEKDSLKNGKQFWRCLCDCGNEKITSTSLLNGRKVRSCGCLRQELGNNRRNLEGKRFGRLTVLSMTDKRDYKGSIVWNAQCDCGNIIQASQDNLMQGNYQSCGCRRKEHGKELGQFLTFVNGTCIEWLQNRKHRSDNTSGYQGVYKKKNGKYVAGISLCRKRYYIGTYEDFESAVNARKKAEKYLHEGFVEAYRDWEMELVSKNLSAEEYPFEFKVDDRFWNEF